MEFQVKVRELKELLKRTQEKNRALMQDARYQNDDKKIQVKLKSLLKGELDVLIAIVKDRIKAVPSDRHNKWLLNRINEYLDLREQPVGDDTKIQKLEQLPVSITKYLEDHAPRRWVFQESDDKMFLPWVVVDVSYNKRRRDRDGFVYPAYVTVALQAFGSDKKSDSERITEDTFDKWTVRQVFNHWNFKVETEAAVKRYEKEMETWAKYQGACGVQLHAIGEAYTSSSDRWGGSRYATEPMIKNDQPTRVVMDNLSPEITKDTEQKSRVQEVPFWNESPNLNTNGLQLKVEVVEADEDGDELPEEEKVLNAQVALPIHPYLNCFDIDAHRWLRIHSGNLQQYPWDEKLIDKLIIPQEQSDLLKILISKSGENVEDIVRGKMSGVIVVATGQPGVGKTLTAEVFSEFIHKPLYNVQCSQLGLDIDTIEKNLTVVLGRASRWGAVMLIDEADVYIRQRGNDITQNAIVGVFLRLLEYYRGVLFMTSNMGDIIDDAIISRATAWIQYELPDGDTLSRIWKVLGKQYLGKEMDDLTVKVLRTKIGRISGRSVRNLLKLAVMLEGKKATVNTLLKVAKYQALESRKADQKD